MGRLAEWVHDKEAQNKSALWNAVSRPATQWADLQPTVSYDHGFLAGVKHVIGLEYEEVEESQ